MARLILVIVVLIGAVGSVGVADVFSDAAIAQQRMRQLAVGLAMYWNEYHDASPPSPPSPADLFPEYVSDPLVFWHPGDSDAAPTTIDNNAVNAANSASISFEWVDFAAGGDRVADSVILRDNSAANNGGLFVSMITADGVIETDPPLATPTPTAGELAQIHLRRLADALNIYASENQARLPDDLLTLWELGHVESPRTFWHPGDSDPMPTDITNSVLNGVNSTQISFEFVAAGELAGALPCGAVVLRDNTPANNGGAFIYIVAEDLRILTDPYQPVTYTPALAMITGGHRLRTLGQAMHIYANEYRDAFPDDLIRLWEAGAVCHAEDFWHPGDDDPRPEVITNSGLDLPNSTQVSFEYFGAGMTVDEPPTTMLMRDISPRNNAGLGRNVLYVDSHVEFEFTGTRGDGNADGAIDLSDWEMMTRCLVSPAEQHDVGPWIDEATYCPVFDFDESGVVDLADLAAFMAAFTGPVD